MAGTVFKGAFKRSSVDFVNQNNNFFVPSICFITIHVKERKKKFRTKKHHNPSPVGV